jgi:hypothetical protein
MEEWKPKNAKQRTKTIKKPGMRPCMQGLDPEQWPCGVQNTERDKQHCMRFRLFGLACLM